MVSLVFATPAFIMWLQVLEWEVLLAGAFDREDAQAFKPVALACATLCWFISELHNPGLVVPKIEQGGRGETDGAERAADECDAAAAA